MANENASVTICTICWEEASETCGRSIAKLQCSHVFHLDCIGSAFNATGIMQCPNCRHVENGEWRRFVTNDEEESDEDYDRTDDELPDMVPQHCQQCLENDNRCLVIQQGMAFPSQGHPECSTSSAGNLYGPPITTEVSSSQFIFPGRELAQSPGFAPMFGNFIGANQNLVPSATVGPPQCDTGALPDFGSFGDRAVFHPGGRSPPMQEWLSAQQVAPPPLQFAHHESGPAMSPLRNYPSPVLRGRPFFSPVHNNQEAEIPPNLGFARFQYPPGVSPFQVHLNSFPGPS